MQCECVALGSGRLWLTMCVKEGLSQPGVEVKDSPGLKECSVKNLTDRKVQ